MCGDRTDRGDWGAGGRTRLVSGYLGLDRLVDVLVSTSLSNVIDDIPVVGGET